MKERTIQKLDRKNYYRNLKREPAWSESITIGNEEIVEQAKEKLRF